MHHQHRGRRLGHRRLGQRWYSRDNVLPRLEEYRKDLEQELADVSDLIRRLKESQPAETSEV
jgi:hypothetical protein